MNSILDIINELLLIDSDIATQSEKLQREMEEISRTIDKTQCTFGDQQACVNIINTMYNTLQVIISADGALNTARQSVKVLVQNLQK